MGVISNTKSALSRLTSIKGDPLGQHNSVTRFIKGVFNTDPPTLKYDVILNPEELLLFFKNLRGNKQLNFKNVILKTIWLIDLKTQQRVQTISSLSRNNFI